MDFTVVYCIANDLSLESQPQTVSATIKTPVVSIIPSETFSLTNNAGFL